MRAMMEILVLRLIWTFHSKGTGLVRGLELVLDVCGGLDILTGKL